MDIEQKKAAGKGRGYERWATMHNLKQMAATLNVYQEYGFTSPEHLEAAGDTAYQMCIRDSLRPATNALAMPKSSDKVHPRLAAIGAGRTGKQAICVWDKCQYCLIRYRLYFYMQIPSRPYKPYRFPCRFQTYSR